LFFWAKGKDFYGGKKKGGAGILRGRLGRGLLGRRKPVGKGSGHLAFYDGGEKKFQRGKKRGRGLLTPQGRKRRMQAVLQEKGCAHHEESKQAKGCQGGRRGLKILEEKEGIVRPSEKWRKTVPGKKKTTTRQERAWERPFLRCKKNLTGLADRNKKKREVGKRHLGRVRPAGGVERKKESSWGKNCFIPLEKGKGCEKGQGPPNNSVRAEVEKNQRGMHNPGNKKVIRAKREGLEKVGGGGGEGKSLRLKRGIKNQPAKMWHRSKRSLQDQKCPGGEEVCHAGRENKRPKETGYPGRKGFRGHRGKCHTLKGDSQNG